MRRLVLMRHAKAVEPAEEQTDHERVLRPSGRRDAELMGAYLAGLEPAIDEVLCSSAARARETWQRASLAFEKAPPVQVMPELYLPTLEGLRAALRHVQRTTHTVLVVGHNPSLDAFVLEHAARADDAMRRRVLAGLSTASVVVMEFASGLPARGLRARAKIVALTRPAELSAGAAAEVPRAKKAERVHVTRAMTVRELSSEAIGSAIDHVRANGQVERLGEDPEFVHQQRVGVRKLRVYLRLCEKQVGKAKSERLTDELRWLFAKLADARDRDVLELSTLARLRDEGLTLTAPEQARLHEQRLRSHRRLARALGSARYARLMRDLAKLAARLTHAEQRDGKLAYKWLAKRLSRRADAVHELSRGLDSSDTNAVHELRKQLKKLRYTAELVRHAYDEHAAKRFLKRVESLQDLLGALNDRSVAATLLERTLHDVKRAGAKATLKTLTAQLAKERATLLAQLAPALKALDEQERFWT
jgi:phosphohistidine phosphatase